MSLDSTMNKGQVDFNRTNFKYVSMNKITIADVIWSAFIGRL